MKLSWMPSPLERFQPKWIPVRRGKRDHLSDLRSVRRLQPVENLPPDLRAARRQDAFLGEGLARTIGRAVAVAGNPARLRHQQRSGRMVPGPGAAEQDEIE